MGQDFSSAVQKASKENPVQKLELMSDSELLAYWEQAQAQGYNLNQLKTLARAQGASEGDISKFEKRIKSINKTKTKVGPLLETETNLSSIFGITGNEIDDDSSTNEEKYSLPIFGMNFFDSKPPSSDTSPQLNMATPAYYQLGPGDEIAINVWGASENQYNAIINNQGSIKLDRIAPIYLSGYSISSAKKRIGNALSKVYSGINSSEESFQKVFFDVSLSRSRSIVLNIVGDVQNPGTYTLPSIISPLNALYAAGGPNENGSFRNIKILRNGKPYKTIDLYDYFVKGLYPTLSLRDQDVILVPSYSKRVFVNGEFKKTGIFELKEKETISNLLNYTGGLNSFAYKEKVFIESISGINKTMAVLNSDSFSSKIVQDGDIVSAKPVGDKFLNRVTIEGAVYLPGDYSLQENSNLKELILNAQGLKDYAFTRSAVIYRFFEGKENKILSVDLEDVLSEKKEIALEPNDRVVIFSKLLLSEQNFVEIKGQVNSPKRTNFYKGMTLVDLILLSDGIKEDGDSYLIDVFRKTYDKTGTTPFKSLSANIDYKNSRESFLLEKDDLVVVRLKEGVTKNSFVTINGLVKSPGPYAILNNKYSLYDLLNDAGGILKDGSLKGVKVKRINKAKKEIEKLVSSTDTLGVEISDLEDYIEFGVDIAQLYKTKGTDLKYNVILKDGDVIEIPKADYTIQVIGEVQRPTVINFKKGMTALQAINQAGGVTDLAKKRGSFVVYQNGNVSSFKRFLFFNFPPRLEPGSKIIVPKKVANPNKTSLAEIIGLTSTLATLAVLINSL